MTTTDVPDLLSAAHDLDPQPLYRHLRDQTPVVYHAGSESFLVARHEDILRLLRGLDVDSSNYGDSAGTVFGRTVLQMDGKEHQKHRMLINPMFQPAAIEELRPTILRVVTEEFLPHLQNAVDEAAASGGGVAEIDLVPTYFDELPIRVIELLLDLSKDNHENFVRWFNDMHAQSGNVGHDPEVQQRGMKAHDDMAEYLQPIIDERKANPGRDLISRMCQAEVDGQKLTDEEIISFGRIMITAGGETTSKALGLMMMNLLQHPDQLAAVRANRALIDNAFVETLRFSSPVAFSGRRAVNDIELHGVTIPQGASINLLLGAGNRDPRKFSDPDTFDIFRPDNPAERGFSGAAAHLGFLNGRHHCIGAQLARAEIQVAFNVMFDNMDNLQFAEGFVPKPTGLWTRGVPSLKVAFTPKP
jgi:pulcherriminic acid synthase